MNKRNLLTSGNLIVILLILVVAIFIFFIITNPIVYDVPYSIGEDASYCGDEIYFTFDNSTPEATAVSIARLNEGMIGFGSNVLYNSGYANYIKSNASLTSDKKYWIVNMQMDINKWVVTIDAKTLMSKKNGKSFEGTVNKWRSLDELKAKYIAELKTIAYGNLTVGKPYNVTLDGKPIWKVPVYKKILKTYNGEIAGYVYVDIATGKSKGFLTGMERWSTLKEVDDALTKIGSPYSPLFKDALRDLYFN
ncbi:hypothetical protein [Methanobacterium sp.]|uniref:hypothetical protein n=1 Tax=Methanobacterium sp. TaxID=2164 RepID=UPI003C730C64